MILRSIEVEGWRCFAAAVRIGPFADGLNIIYGPNGIGKSSLMTALARGLFDNHAASGAEIKALRPWGRDLAPKVTIEFEQQGDHFRLHKQFLSGAVAKLDRRENQKYVPLAESRDADKRARQILAGESSRGASDQRHWGLAQILWATQGSLKIDFLAGDTRATIQDALGAQVTGVGSEALEQRIADIYGQYFTAKTGQLRKGAGAPAIVGLESQLAKAMEVRSQYQQRLQEFEDASRRIEDLRLRTGVANRNEQELDGRLKQVREQVAAYAKLIAQQQQYQSDVSREDESYQNLVTRIETIKQADEELAAANLQLKELNDVLPVQEKLVANCEAAAKQADDAVREVRGRRGEVVTAQQLAQLAERYLRSRNHFTEIDKRIRQIDGLEQELKQLRQAREPIVAPDQKKLKQIVKIARRRDDARLKLDAALITVTLQLESEHQLDVSQAETMGRRAIAANEEHQLKGAPDVAFQIPGVGKFRATGPTGDFDELRSQWESAVGSLHELTAGYGSQDLAVLEALHTRASELDQKIARTEASLAAILDGESADQLRSERSLAKKSLEEIESSHSDWKESPPDPKDLSRQAVELEGQLDAQIRKAESAKDQTYDALQMERQKQLNYAAQVSSLQSQVAACQRRLEQLRNDGLDDHQRQQQRTRIALQRDTAHARLTEVKQQIAELGEDPSRSLTQLEAQQTAFRREADEADKKLNTETGRLQQITSEAPYAALVEIEEEIASLEQEIGRQQLQLNAIQLLHETVVEQKTAVMQSLIDPIRLRANVMLQRISGTRFDGVEFDESLLPTGVAPRSSDEAVALDQISGGEQEQVHFAVRMALADVAFPADRQLVVLDDVFTYTDASRLARIANILAEAAKRFQIVLMTCHPERYRGLPDAEFFDLEKIVSGE